MTQCRDCGFVFGDDNPFVERRSWVQFEEYVVSGIKKGEVETTDIMVNEGEYFNKITYRCDNCGEEYSSLEVIKILGEE